MDEKKRKEKVKDLSQLLSKMEKTAKSDMVDDLKAFKQNPGPEILNTNSRFPTFRYRPV